jgi:hypothetical protein
LSNKTTITRENNLISILTCLSVIGCSLILATLTKSANEILIYNAGISLICPVDQIQTIGNSPELPIFDSWKNH